MDEQLLGRGLTFPLAVGNAGLGESSGIAKVDESIRIILGTQYGERLMRPRFGCNLGSLAFAPNNAATANLARYYVAEGLAQWEPRIEVLQVDVVNDNLGGALLILVRYRLRASQDLRTLDYRFSLERSP
jgi:phage baseplate assembly protein W